MAWVVGRFALSDFYSCQNLRVSYDLDVYTSQSLDRAGLVGLADGVRDLRVVGAPVVGDAVTVVRGQRETYCCTVNVSCVRLCGTGVS